MESSRTMGRRFPFALSIAFNATLFQFLLVAILGTFVYSGEDAQELGMTWLISTPFTLSGGLACAPFFGWYERKRIHSPAILPYALLIVGVAIVDPIMMIGVSITALSLFGV